MELVEDTQNVALIVVAFHQEVIDLVGRIGVLEVILRLRRCFDVPSASRIELLPILMQHSLVCCIVEHFVVDVYEVRPEAGNVSEFDSLLRH